MALYRLSMQLGVYSAVVELNLIHVAHGDIKGTTTDTYFEYNEQLDGTSTYKSVEFISV